VAVGVDVVEPAAAEPDARAIVFRHCVFTTTPRQSRTSDHCGARTTVRMDCTPTLRRVK